MGAAATATANKEMTVLVVQNMIIVHKARSFTGVATAAAK
jgi:hypothetical protein